MQLRKLEAMVNEKNKKITEKELKMKELEENRGKQLLLTDKVKFMLQQKVGEEELKEEKEQFVRL